MITKNILGWILLSLVSSQALSAQDVNRFEDEILAFEEADRLNPPQKHGILFLGSSSIKLWETLEQDFAGYPVLNRGFGGSQCSDAIHFFDRIVTPYHPDKIAFYEGDNDLANGMSPEDVLADFKIFMEKINDLDSKIKVAFIAIKPSPARWNLAEVMKTANQMIKDYCESHAQLTFVDIFSPMLNAYHKPQADLYVKDQLHMNAKGYDIWKTALEPFVNE